MNKILLVGFVCVSLGAFAQTSADQGQTSSAKTAAATPRDAASGQASGKRMHQPMVIHRDIAARDQATGKATGKTMASDDWSTAKGSSTGQSSPRVATGDVNGDGKADLKATKSSGHAVEKDAVMTTGSSVQTSREASSGMATGKRQHQPMTIQKQQDASSPK